MTYFRYTLSDKDLITSIWYCYISILAGNYKMPRFAVTAYAYYIEDICWILRKIAFYFTEWSRKLIFSRVA